MVDFGPLTEAVIDAARDRLRALRTAAPVSFRIIESPHMVERVLYARSPARARRRMKRGFPQHYITRPMREALKMPDGTLVMHPAMATAMRAAIKDRADG